MSDLNGEKKDVYNDRMLINLYRHARIMGDITMDAHLVVTIHNTNNTNRWRDKPLLNGFCRNG